MPSALSEELLEIVGRAQFFREHAVDRRYMVDFTGAPCGTPFGLVRPRTTQEVSAILRACHRARQPVVVQGGRTGLARGAVPLAGELIVSLERMTTIGHPDVAGLTLEVEAGAVLSDVQDAAHAADLLFGVDIGARGSCTVGGMIATNAGGNQVIRYGMMRDNILGLEVVLADGTIISALSAMQKNNTGYDLKHLFVGAEGTLGIVTRAVLRLRPAPRTVATALCAVTDEQMIVPLLNQLQEALDGRLEAYEVMWADYYREACTIRGGFPLREGYPAYVLIEAAGSGMPTGLEDALQVALERSAIADALIARSLADADRFWSIRDSSGDLGIGLPNIEPFDISIPIASTVEFIDCLRAKLTEVLPDATPFIFGHVGDGNLHIILKLADEGDRSVAAELVYSIVRAASGSVSAEHGIGMLKRDHLSFTRNPAEIALMKRLRHALDPACILNRGRIFE